MRAKDGALLLLNRRASVSHLLAPTIRARELACIVHLILDQGIINESLQPHRCGCCSRP